MSEEVWIDDIHHLQVGFNVKGYAVMEDPDFMDPLAPLWEDARKAGLTLRQAFDQVIDRDWDDWDWSSPDKR
jgi:hypothetical protein